MKFSHKAEIIEAPSTNLDLKEGEESLAKHGDGKDDENAWRCHGGCGFCVRYGEGEERKLREKWRWERIGKLVNVSKWS